MFKLALRGVRMNVGRYVATLVAIMTGVAFFTAAGFLSDRVIDALEGEQLGHFLGGDFATRRPRMCKTLALREQPLRDPT